MNSVKILSLVAMTGLAISRPAKAYSEDPDFDLYPTPSHRKVEERSSGGISFYRCSTTERVTTVSRVDHALVHVSHHRRLRHASRFQTKIRELAKIRSVKERADEYLMLAGVRDPSNNREVARALNRNADHRPNLAALRQNLDLIAEGAVLVFDAVQNALIQQGI